MRKVCVIDDDPSMRTILNSVLKTEFEVEVYESAEEFLSNSIIPEFDAVLTDVNLPGMSGIDMIRFVRDKDDSIPVVLMTGMNDFETAITALKEGAFDFIVKPFLMEQAIISVQKAVERRLLFSENRSLLEELTEKNHQLEDLYRQIQKRNFQMERDIDIACDLQENLFPRSFPDIDRVDFTLSMQPLDKISGDFFDILPLGGRKFLLILADVCGHGVPAALYSALIKPIVISYDKTNVSPAGLVGSINEYLISSQKRMVYSYAAIFCAVFDPDAGVITFCNAGIPAPVLINNPNEISRLDSNGTIVGIFGNVSYVEMKVTIGKGSKVILFTDGAFEGLPEPTSVQGYEDLVNFIDVDKNKNLKNITDDIFLRLIDENGESRIRDDVTIIGIEFR